MNEKLASAYLAWTKTFPGSAFQGTTHTHQGTPYQSSHLKGEVFAVPPHWDGSCQCTSHWETINLPVEGSVARVITRLKKYADVCVREQAWRHYLSVREGKDLYRHEHE